MSIEYVKGNLLDFPGVNVIAQICNCKNIMGGGLALQIKEEYPAAFEADTAAAKVGENQLGMFSVATLPNGKRIVNLYCQYDIGTDKRQIDYEATTVALTRLKELLENANKEGRNYSVGLPAMMGCGLAGGDWHIVKAIIESIFEKSPIKVVIVEYTKKKLAIEDSIDKK